MNTVDNHLKVICLLNVETRAILLHREAVVEFRQVDGGILLVAHLCQLAAFFNRFYTLLNLLDKQRGDSLLERRVVQHACIEFLIDFVSNFPRTEVQVLCNLLQTLAGVLDKLLAILRILWSGVVVILST